MKQGRRKFLATAGAALFGGAFLVHRSLFALGPSQKSVPGKKWGMVIDVEKCMSRAGCNACREACGQAHNVPNIDTVKEEIEWIWKEPFERVFRDRMPALTDNPRVGHKIPVLCNHCDNAPCVKVCPTKATWRRADGIVMMDMHRCIGCRYCMAACPYGSRSFNFRDPAPYIQNANADFPRRTVGVVEKCNFCEERLAQNRLPACVEAAARVGCNAMEFVDLLNPSARAAKLLASKNLTARSSALGTLPKVYYIL